MSAKPPKPIRKKAVGEAPKPLRKRIRKNEREKRERERNEWERKREMRKRIKRRKGINRIYKKFG